MLVFCSHLVRYVAVGGRGRVGDDGGPIRQVGYVRQQMETLGNSVGPASRHFFRLRLMCTHSLLPPALDGT